MRISENHVKLNKSDFFGNVRTANSENFRILVLSLHLFMCLSIDRSLYIYIYMNVYHTTTYISTCMYIRVYYIYIYIYIYMNVYYPPIYIHRRICTYIHIHVHVHVYVYMYIYACVYI